MKKVFAVVLLVPTLLTSCADPAAGLPPDSEIAAGLSQVLLDTGFFSDAKISRFIGKHYLPGEDRWQIVACFEFSDAQRAPVLECSDTFKVFRLDSGRWVVSVSRAGVYRWREIIGPGEQPMNVPTKPDSNG